jgi:nicotinamide-nucleotide amidase
MQVSDRARQQAHDVIAALRTRGWTLATGESLTAGLIASTLAEVPGCSDVLRGGVVAYQVDLKKQLLQVDDAALAHGVVSKQVAQAMACGAARALGATVGVGSTGAAGPQPHDGAEPGTVWVSVCVQDPQSNGEVEFRSRDLSPQESGNRVQVRTRATEAALEELWTLFCANATHGGQ